jgi:spermidine synthase
MIIVVLMMMFQPFLSEYHIVRIIYLVSYVILLTTICFALRGKKMLFFGFCVVMIISHFLPNKIHTFFDLTIISMLAMLFYMQNYVLQEVESAFSKLKVIYDYKANKVLLCADNIVQSEQYYYGNSNHIPNFNYYGNTLNTGPVYDIFSKCDSKNLHKNVAVIGLGAGTIAAYGKEGQNFTFYEIDPEVRLIANNQEYFTFLKTSKANVSFVMGDARKTLEKAKDQEYGIIFIDVYKGNAIPESFLTIEAVNLYLRKLQQGGLIVIHITTDNSGVESILGKLAIDLKLDAYVTCVDEYSSDNDQQTDVSGLIVRKGGNNKWYSSLLKNLLSFSGIKTVSSSGAVSKWVIISRNKKDLLDLISDHSWHILAVDADQEIVTDESIGYGDTARGIITKKIN